MVLIGMLPKITTDKYFKKSISMMKVKLDQFEDLLRVLTTVNEFIQSLIHM
jgi:hypothetical protein